MDFGHCNALIASTPSNICVGSWFIQGNILLNIKAYIFNFFFRGRMPPHPSRGSRLRGSWLRLRRFRTLLFFYFKGLESLRLRARDAKGLWECSEVPFFATVFWGIQKMLRKRPVGTRVFRKSTVHSPQATVHSRPSTYVVLCLARA